MASPILRKANTKTISDEWFVEHGIPISIRTDGGPQFRGPFVKWCGRHNIRHELSSEYHHESNGHAECAVREVKILLAKTPSYKEFQQALQNYRKCPRYDELQRRQRTGKLRAHANKSSRPKPQMHPGQHIIAQHLLSKRWDLSGEILENRDNR